MRIYFAWTANSEQDIAGYKIYAGATTGTYDHGNSPKIVTGQVTTGFFDIGSFSSVADFGSPMFFALTAFNTSDQESGFSTEIERTLNRPVTLFRR